MICQSAQIFVFAMEVICLIISQVIYNDSKGMFIDALFNIVTAFGVIIYVLCRNDIFIIPVNKYIVEMVYLAMLCVPYTCLDMKVKGLSRRIRVINKN